MLLNFIKHHRPDIDKIYLYVKDPLESKYQLLINGREKVGIKNLSPPVTELFLRGRKLNLSLVLHHNLISRYLEL